jgi:N-acyl-D-amino-acid deacylase
MEHDLVIRGGTVIDGTGTPGYRADVGIVGDRIATIGQINDSGRHELDAEGHVVTPGFIDLHTHMDAQVFWDPLGTCSVYHGITTVVMGNCGFSLAPASFGQSPLVVRNLERAEDISGAAMAAGINWTWSDFASYLDALDATPKGINYAANIGHSALRTWAMGERAFSEPATEADMVVMEHELRSALRAGAVGFTTSRLSAHETSDDRPVASRLAAWEEVERLVTIMGAESNGVFEIAQETAVFMADADARNDFLQRLQQLCLGGVPVTFGLIAAQQAPWAWRSQVELIEQTTALGGRMFGLTHSREFSVLVSFKTRLPFDKLPEWAELRALPLDAQRLALANPTTRARLVEIANNGNYGRAIGAEARKPDYTWLRVMRHPVGGNPTVAELAAQRGIDPVEVMIELALETNFDQLFQQVIGNRDPDDVFTLLNHPNTVMTFSDSGAHVSQIMDSSIQTHLLAYWVRDRKMISLERAVQMLTSVPAAAWGFADRGTLTPGAFADINVLDPDTVAPNMPTVVNDLPGGAKRLLQTATGFRATIVAGEVLLRDGVHTGALPGRVVRV